MATAAITELTNATARIGVRIVTAEERSVIVDVLSLRAFDSTALMPCSLVMLADADASIPSGSGSRV